MRALMLALLMVGAAQADEVHIDIKGFMFDPQPLEIAIGTTVTWINHDPIPHTVAETSHLFRSAALDTDERFSWTFKDPGTYQYFCTVHPQMVGTIHVVQR
ncbi:cupredoxin domain-containing protein [Pseudomonas putida]